MSRWIPCLFIVLVLVTHGIAGTDLAVPGQAYFRHDVLIEGAWKHPTLKFIVYPVEPHSNDYDVVKSGQPVVMGRYCSPRLYAVPRWKLPSRSTAIDTAGYPVSNVDLKQVWEPVPAITDRVVTVYRITGVDKTTVHLAALPEQHFGREDPAGWAASPNAPVALAFSFGVVALLLVIFVHKRRGAAIHPSNGAPQDARKSK